MSMQNEKIEINRTLVGFLAFACLAGSVGIYWNFAGNETWELWRAGFMRVGILMSAFWLALPSKGREAAWARVSPHTFVILVIAVIALMRVQLRILIPSLAVALVVSFFLRPRNKQRPSSRTGQ